MPLFEWPVLQCATVSKGIAKNQTCSGTQFFATFIVVKEEREGRKGTERCDFVTLLFMKGVHSRRTRTPFSAAWTWAASSKVLALSFFPLLQSHFKCADNPVCSLVFSFDFEVQRSIKPGGSSSTEIVSQKCTAGTHNNNTTRVANVLFLVAYM